MTSKKDYVAIAKIIRYSLTKAELILKLTKYFKDDNPKFNGDKFIEACGEVV